MLVIGVVAEVVDVGIFSDGDGENVGFDPCRERQATQGLIPIHAVSGCARICELCDTHKQNGQF